MLSCPTLVQVDSVPEPYGYRQHDKNKPWPESTIEVNRLLGYFTQHNEPGSGPELRNACGWRTCTERRPHRHFWAFNVYRRRFKEGYCGGCFWQSCNEKEKAHWHTFVPWFDDEQGWKEDSDNEIHEDGSDRVKFERQTPECGRQELVVAALITAPKATARQKDPWPESAMEVNKLLATFPNEVSDHVQSPGGLLQSACAWNGCKEGHAHRHFWAPNVYPRLSGWSEKCGWTNITDHYAKSCEISAVPHWHTFIPSLHMRHSHQEREETGYPGWNAVMRRLKFLEGAMVEQKLVVMLVVPETLGQKAKRWLEIDNRKIRNHNALGGMYTPSTYVRDGPFGRAAYGSSYVQDGPFG